MVCGKPEARAGGRRCHSEAHAIGEQVILSNHGGNSAPGKSRRGGSRVHLQYMQGARPDHFRDEHRERHTGRPERIRPDHPDSSFMDLKAIVLLVFHVLFFRVLLLQTTFSISATDISIFNTDRTKALYVRYKPE